MALVRRVTDLAAPRNTNRCQCDLGSTTLRIPGRAIPIDSRRAQTAVSVAGEKRLG
ncbi:MAG: hypothetical protein CM1200mP41_26990 [Gammaproteobacteria bacterium]|nr:MAG: hypothetical protein CM1200mP41_26990 [Gammaproteobacteria bacterium]